MDKSIIGILFFIATFIAGRLISERALKLLSDEERGKLLHGFSKYRIASLVGVIILVVIYYSSRAANPDSYVANYSVFVGVLVLYLLGSTVYAFRKLKLLELPDNYINQFLLSTFVQYIGLFVFFGFMVNRS